jgi:putative tricarboxylic transport membrane protein
MLLILNLPLVGIWARLVMVPYPVLGPLILIFSVLGAFSVRNSTFDVWVALAFGLLGYAMRKLDFSETPLVLTLILTPILESSLRQSLSMSAGDVRIFLERPVALGLAALGVVLAAATLYARRRAGAGATGAPRQEGS